MSALLQGLSSLDQGDKLFQSVLGSPFCFCLSNDSGPIGISASDLSAMVANAKNKAVARRSPPVKYLLDDDNPYRKKYGSEKNVVESKQFHLPHRSKF